MGTHVQMMIFFSCGGLCVLEVSLQSSFEFVLVKILMVTLMPKHILSLFPIWGFLNYINMNSDHLPCVLQAWYFCFLMVTLFLMQLFRHFPELENEVLSPFYEWNIIQGSQLYAEGSVKAHSLSLPFFPSLSSKTNLLSLCDHKNPNPSLRQLIFNTSHAEISAYCVLLNTLTAVSHFVSSSSFFWAHRKAKHMAVLTEKVHIFKRLCINLFLVLIYLWHSGSLSEVFFLLNIPDASFSSRASVEKTWSVNVRVASMLPLWFWGSSQQREQFVLDEFSLPYNVSLSM